MKLCRTFLGDFFFRTLGHDWRYTEYPKPFAYKAIRACTKCGRKEATEHYGDERAVWTEVKP